MSIVLTLSVIFKLSSTTTSLTWLTMMMLCRFVLTNHTFYTTIICLAWATSYMNPELMGKSASKGKRLIILYTITPNGPLCEQDPMTDVPYNDLIWKGDIPHPKEFDKREDSTNNWLPASSFGFCRRPPAITMTTCIQRWLDNWCRHSNGCTQGLNWIGHSDY